MIIRSIFLLLSTAALVAACDRGESATPAMTPASGKNSTFQNDLETLANAHCDREQRCHNVGSDEKYSDREHCLTVMRDENREDLASCGKGLNRSGFNQCVAELSEQDCEGVTEGYRRVIACDDLCAE